MQKISSNDAASLLKQAGAAIRNLTQERNVLREKVASYERGQRVEKIAREMEDKGLNSDLDFEQKLAALSQAQNLDVTEEAVKLAAPQGRIIGNPDELQPGGGVHAFEHFIMTGEDPS
jgi:hypothetical protein